jgi:hypothetical protein
MAGTIVPFGKWLPDLPALQNPGALTVTNAIPKTQSYGPLGSLVAYSGALGARCQGAVAARADNGATSIFAGDATKLYSIDTAAAFNDVSASSGYTTAADETWRFCQYAGRVIGTNYANDIQTFQLGVDSVFSQLSSGAPRARHVAVIDPGFVMAGNTFDGVDGEVPNRVWWSEYGVPTSWPTIGTTAAEAAQSDYNDLPTGGWVQSLIGAVGGAAGLVFCDTAIYRIDYEGPPTVFRFTNIERARGTPAPNSVVNIGPFAAYLGEDGFYLCDGAQSRPIGNGAVDKTFFSDLNQSYFHRIYASSDPINKLIFWVYPSTGSVTGNPDSCLIYNWETTQWAKAEFDCEFLFRALSTGYSLEDLDSLGYTLDTLPFSLDSRVWTGGRIILSAFDTTHKLSFFTGSNLQATIDTGEFENQGFVNYCDGARIIVNGGTPTLSIGYRNTPQSSVTFTTPSVAGDDGVARQRISARYMRARVVIPSGSSWSHAQGIQPEILSEGER